MISQKPFELQTSNFAQTFPPIMSPATSKMDEIRWSYHLQIWHADKLWDICPNHWMQDLIMRQMT